jgi:hypothetical protein
MRASREAFSHATRDSEGYAKPSFRLVVGPACRRRRRAVRKAAGGRQACVSAIQDGESRAAEGGDAVESRQPPFHYRSECGYGVQLLYHAIGTVVLAAITTIAGLSLIGFGPRVNPHTAARVDPPNHAVRSTRPAPPTMVAAASTGREK